MGRRKQEPPDQVRLQHVYWFGNGFEAVYQVYAADQIQARQFVKENIEILVPNWYIKVTPPVQRLEQVTQESGTK